MCKHVSETVQGTLSGSQGESSTVFPIYKLFSYFGCIMRSLMICTLTQYCAGDKIEKSEMGGACGTYAGRER